jgi:E-phenylitaconyl-CoA hydratase
MPIEHTKDNGIATITLNRVEKLNALDAEHVSALRAALSEADADAGVRVIILTGRGERSFCVGADLTASLEQQRGVAEAFGFDLEQSGKHGLYIRLFDLSTLRIRKPIIGAINGFCLGGGLELALQCDLIVASDTASFGLPEVRVASLPGGGGVPNLLRAIPRAIAMRMLLTGERINGAQALQYGLVGDLFPAAEFMARTRDLASRIADNGPLAIQLVKMLATQPSATGSALQLTELSWGLLRDTDDRLEGRRAFSEKRKPRYLGR